MPKVKVIAMIRRPEPSVSPAGALYVALLASACLSAATAALLQAVSHGL